MVSSTSGFQISYEIKDGLYGKGIFAEEFIPKGTCIWVFAPCKFDQTTPYNVITYKNEAELRNRLSDLTPEECLYLLDHAYMFNDTVNEILDDGKYWNHSSTPNTGNFKDVDNNNSYALRDIQAGEELFDDYREYQYEDWYVKICQEYDSTWDFIYTS